MSSEARERVKAMDGAVARRSARGCWRAPASLLGAAAAAIAGLMAAGSGVAGGIGVEVEAPEGIHALPASRSGNELLGKPLDLSDLQWVDPRPKIGAGPTGKVTLVRWFTDGCPFCARSLPAIRRLQQEFGDDGFQTVAVYHPKPPRQVSEKDARRAAKELGYSGFLAVDPRWKTLRRIYLSSHPSGATSISLLLDRQGRVRYVHPGPEFGPTEPARANAPARPNAPAGPAANPELMQINQDYEDIRMAIRILLAPGARREASMP